MLRPHCRHDQTDWGITIELASHWTNCWTAAPEITFLLPLDIWDFPYILGTVVEGAARDTDGEKTMSTYLLKDGTTGTAEAGHKEGDIVTVKLHDENGMSVERTGEVIDVLEA